VARRRPALGCRCPLGRNRPFDSLGAHFLPTHFDPPAFALRLPHKDLRPAAELGQELHVSMRLANLMLEDLTEALTHGWAERDARVAMLLQKERAGVDIAVPKAAIDEVLNRG
jgi:3-hydroxyisobutyrate dehydrogenase-like beta-hydroxyacid dehydrogenase